MEEHGTDFQLIAASRKALLVVFALGALLSFPSSSIAETPDVGSQAPDFSLSTPEGHAIRLSDLTSKGTVVLVLLRGYPGYQCPFCQKQAHNFVTNASSFAQKGAQILLVYPGPPASLDQHAKDFLSTQPSLPANAHLVIDPDYTFTDRYELRWDAPHETAYPSTFILDNKRTILYRKISHAHGDRTSAADVLAQLTKGDSSHGGIPAPHP